LQFKIIENTRKERFCWKI